MGWYMRRSFRIAPGVRVNLSKSGLGLSFGVRGFRVSTGPRGSYVHMGRGGIYYRQRIDGAPGRPAHRAAAPPVPPEQDAVWDDPISTVPVAELVDSSSAHVLAALNGRMRSPAYAGIVFVCGCVASLALYLIHPVLLLLMGAFTVYLTWLTDQIDQARRTSHLFYGFDDASRECWLALNRGLYALSQACRVWRVEGLAATAGGNRNAAPGRLTRRRTARVCQEPPAYVVSNVTPYCIDLGAQKLSFMPDRLFVWQQGTYGAVDYTNLAVEWGSTSAIEDGPLPPDAAVIGSIWEHANKDGSPDRRFASNRELPIANYGYLTLRSSTGLSVTFVTSSVSAAKACAEAITVRRGSP